MPTENDFGNMLPSNHYTEYQNISNGDTFSAPDNGWICLNGTISNNIPSYVSISGNPSEALAYSDFNGSLSMMFPVVKGKTFRVWFMHTSDTTMKFIYPIGQKSIIKY